MYMYINDLQYFSNLRILEESENISDFYLEGYADYLDKLNNHLKIRIRDLDNMNGPKWIVTQVDMKIDNKSYVSEFDVELIEMHLDLED